MKIFKFAVITLIAIAAFSFNSADAQVIVKARIGSGHVYHRPVRRPVYHRGYYHHRRPYYRHRAYHHGPVRRYHRY
jgi:hypothetical protein